MCIFFSRVVTHESTCLTAKFQEEAIEPLQAERLAFRLYDALKIRSTGSFSFLAILQYTKYCRFAIVH